MCRMCASSSRVGIPSRASVNIIRTHAASPSSRATRSSKASQRASAISSALRSESAAEAGILLKGPEDWGAPVGYWAYIADPDGNVLEISHGQQVELTVENRPG